jgi:hypothetical protein
MSIFDSASLPESMLKRVTGGAVTPTGKGSETKYPGTDSSRSHTWNSDSQTTNAANEVISTTYSGSCVKDDNGTVIGGTAC